jgi:hypothetical protein
VRTKRAIFAPTDPSAQNLRGAATSSLGSANGARREHDLFSDCYVPPAIDDALNKVAAQFPGLVYVAPKFESPACPTPPNAAHLY